eukprot:scaffold125857_cov35-Tisochrysis_lutea.AAC.5
MEAQCYQAFMRSEHFSYILELKAKEGVVPGLPDFRLLRVLGQFPIMYCVARGVVDARCSSNTLASAVPGRVRTGARGGQARLREALRNEGVVVTPLQVQDPPLPVKDTYTREDRTCRLADA